MKVTIEYYTDECLLVTGTYTPGRNATYYDPPEYAEFEICSIKNELKEEVDIALDYDEILQIVEEQLAEEHEAYLEERAEHMSRKDR